MAAPSTGVGTVATTGDVEAGDIAAFESATRIRKATAADMQAWLAWAAKHIPIDGGTLYQPVKYVEVDGDLYLQRDGEPVSPPWA